MNKASKLKIAARYSGNTCIAIAIIELIYRSTLYWKIPVYPGDPYGLGDIIEFLIIAVLLFVIFVSFALSFAVACSKKHRDFALVIRVTLSAMLSFLAVYHLHTLMPNLL